MIEKNGSGKKRGICSSRFRRKNLPGPEDSKLTIKYSSLYNDRWSWLLSTPAGDYINFVPGSYVRIQSSPFKQTKMNFCHILHKCVDQLKENKWKINKSFPICSSQSTDDPHIIKITSHLNNVR